MKLLQIGPIPVRLGGKRRGGVESHVSELSINLIKEGLDVFYFDTSYLSSGSSNGRVFGFKGIFDFLLCFLKGLFICGIKPIRVNNLTFKEWLKVYIFVGRIGELKRTLSIDLAHVHGLNHLCCIACEFALLKYVVTDHGIGHKRDMTYRRGFLKRNIQNAQTVIAISSNSFQDCLLLTEKNKIIKINNPIDIDLDSITSSEKRFNFEYVLFHAVSEAWERKGLVRISSELPTLLEEIGPCKLVIICPDLDFQRLLNANPSIKFSEQVIHLPPQERTSLLSLIYNSKYCILPSAHEGFSIAYIEAAVLGVPFIGYAPNVIEINEIFGVDSNIAFDPEQSPSLLVLIRQIETKTKRLSHHNPLSWVHKVSSFKRAYENAI